MAKCPLLIVAGKEDAECMKKECEWYDQLPRRKETDEIHHGCVLKALSAKLTSLKW